MSCLSFAQLGSLSQIGKYYNIATVTCTYNIWGSLQVSSYNFGFEFKFGVGFGLCGFGVQGLGFRLIFEQARPNLLVAHSGLYQLRHKQVHFHMKEA